MTRSDSAAATEELGRSIAEELAAGDLVLLEGDLAAGKTTLVRGLLRGLGGDPTEVSSPSFVLLQSYRCRRGRIAALHLAGDPEHADGVRGRGQSPRHGPEPARRCL